MQHPSRAPKTNTAERHVSARVGWWSTAVCALPFTYAVLGLLALAAPNYEVFPFFSWFLFPVTPTTVTRFAVMAEHDQAPRSNTNWFENDPTLGETRHSMDAQVLIQALGAAVARKDVASVRQFRATFEHNFLPHPCRYTLFERTYDPVKLWVDPATGKSRDTVMVTFVCGQP